ncbi:DUF4013 domain-containing protein [Methanobacterium lacus]|uniref:DUF4013 domain-containing protein n=1 Tax=Methanobacterium lacus (strain AL-21) TaxID=877455 RepID=UPI0009FE68A1|nr:DUF4013 domain-containing protein [Methanobacterium lacus]
MFTVFLNITGLGNFIAGDIFFGTAGILFNLIGLLILFFIFGYYFRIIQTSLNGASDLPQFKNWMEMFEEGIKIYVVFIVYLIPLVLFTLISGSFEVIVYPAPISQFTSFLWVFISYVFAKEWIIVLLTLYLFIIIPVSYVAIANMVDNNSKLISAFRFREIFSRITKLGLKKLIAFYMAAVIPIFLISYVAIVLGTDVTYLPINLIIAPYLSMFIYRLLALLYISDKESVHASS